MVGGVPRARVAPMANRGLFDQVKDFLLGYPETAGTTATTAEPAPDAGPDALPEPGPKAGPDGGPPPGDA
jgi:hypothetical protein